MTATARVLRRGRPKILALGVGRLPARRGRMPRPRSPGSLRLPTRESFPPSTGSVPAGGFPGRGMPPGRSSGGRRDDPRHPQEEQHVADAHHQVDRSAQGDHVRQRQQDVVWPLQVVLRSPIRPQLGHDGAGR